MRKSPRKGKPSCKRQTCQALRACGLQKDTTLALVDQIDRWCRESGVEWTVSRLKDLKNSFVQQLGGNPVAPNWWKCRRRAGWIIPKGIFGKLFGLKPQRALAALCVYTVFKSTRATVKQKRKFYDSVKAKPVRVYYRPTACFKQIWAMVSLKAHPPLIDPYTSLMKEIRVPTVTQGKVVSVRNSLDAVIVTAAHPFIRAWLRAGVDDRESGPKELAVSSFAKRPASFINLVKDSVSYHLFSRGKTGNIKQDVKLREQGINVYQVDWDAPKGCLSGWASPFSGTSHVVGKISYIQEPGFKLRAVANPFPVFQIALSGFGRTLKRALEKIPEDSTWNQQAGVAAIQTAMQGGLDLISLDLSDATNNFPLRYTEKVLQEGVSYGALRQSDLNLWKDVSKGKWVTPEGSTVRWTRGQPLGVYPSFYAFALSHHALVRTVAPKFYRILGDDIVIDREAGERLKKRYAALGIPLSQAKCLESGKLNEFAGLLISRERYYVSPKLKEPSDHNFIEYVRRLGPQSVHLLRPQQRKVAKLLWEVPQDVHPIGLGYNPSGKPFNQRCQEAQWILSIFSKKDGEVRMSPDAQKLAQLKHLMLSSTKNPDLVTMVRKNRRTLEDVREDLAAKMATASTAAQAEYRMLDAILRRGNLVKPGTTSNKDPHEVVDRETRNVRVHPKKLGSVVKFEEHLLEDVAKVLQAPMLVGNRWTIAKPLGGDPRPVPLTRRLREMREAKKQGCVRNGAARL